MWHLGMCLPSPSFSINILIQKSEVDLTSTSSLVAQVIKEIPPQKFTGGNKEVVTFYDFQESAENQDRSHRHEELSQALENGEAMERQWKTHMKVPDEGVMICSHGFHIN
jgi:hypothetical protein